MYSAQDEIIKQFSALTDWDERYEKIIQLGKSLPSQPDSFKTEDKKVSGCQSRVWLDAQLNNDGEIIFTAETDSMLVRGLISLLLQVYSGQTAEAILATEPYFIEELEFGKFLSPTRANGIYAVLKKIKAYAVAFQYLGGNKLVEL